MFSLTDQLALLVELLLLEFTFFLLEIKFEILKTRFILVLKLSFFSNALVLQVTSSTLNVS